MTETEKRVPDLRFKGFIEDWEQRKFSDLIQTMRGGASIAPDDYKDNGVATVPKGAINSTGIADLSGSKYVSKEFFEKNKNSSVYSDELVTSLRDLVPSAPNMGRIVKLKGKDKRYLMPQGVYNLILLDEVDENFLISFSNTSKFRRIISQEKNGSTQVHIRNSEYLGISIDAPDAEEQNKIGSFFKKLDVTIALHLDKQQQLNLLKKRLLKELFPQHDENLPHIRFANFNETWEQRKLGETVQITMGQSPNGENYTEDPKDHILVQGNADMKNGRVSPRVWTTQVTKKGDPEDIILSVRAPVGDVGKTNYPVVLGRGVAGIKGNAFIFQTLSRMKEIGFWTKYSSGSTFESINSADLKEAVIQIPNIEEQIKIGDFFTKLDDTIALHQQKIDNMQSLKKVLLNKMFI